MADALQGYDDIMGRLQSLDDSGLRIAKAGLTAGLTVLASAVRAGVNGSSASSEMKAGARKTVGQRLILTEGNTPLAKIGFGVGVRRKGTQKAKAAIARSLFGERGLHEAKGVGISAQNIQWPVLGTVERFAHYSGKSGASHRVGMMPAQLKGIVQQAVATEGPRAMEDSRITMSMMIAAEAAKKRS